MCCRGVHGVANPAYPEGFPFPALLSVAPYCVPGGIRVVSRGATDTVRRQVRWHVPATFGTTIRRPPFPRIAARCRIGLDELILLPVVARRYCVYPLGEYIKEKLPGAPGVI